MTKQMFLIIRYMTIAILFATGQALAFVPLVSIPFFALWMDALFHGTILGLLVYALRNVVLFANFKMLNIYQRFINQIALLVLVLFVWLGLGYVFFVFIFKENYHAVLIHLLPSRALIGLLLYWVALLYFRNTKTQNLQQDVPFEENMPVKTKNIHPIERITVKSGAKIHVVLVQDIFYIQAEGDYVRIFTSEGKYLKEQTMKYFEENLASEQFVRVHRSYIVNTQMISRIELYEKQSQLLTLKDGRQIKASQSGYKMLRKALNL